MTKILRFLPNLFRDRSLLKSYSDDCGIRWIPRSATHAFRKPGFSPRGEWEWAAHSAGQPVRRGARSGVVRSRRRFQGCTSNRSTGAGVAASCFIDSSHRLAQTENITLGTNVVSSGFGTAWAWERSFLVSRRTSVRALIEF